MQRYSFWMGVRHVRVATTFWVPARSSFPACS